MPLPTPNSGESESDFVSRCMANPTMQKEFPDAEQRSAVCHRQMSATALAASNPLPVRVIERRDDGSALIEIPVMVVTDRLDLSRTEGGGKSVISVGGVELADMARNFTEWPKPVGVGFDGLDGHQPERGGPQIAFVNSLRVVGERLMAVVELNAMAAALVIDEKAYRAFSMEARKNPQTPTRRLVGWVLTGGIFTNNPATDTQFKIAASDLFDDVHDGRARSYHEFSISASEAAAKRETEMGVSIEKVQADLQLAESKNKETEAELVKLRTSGEELTARLSNALRQNSDLEAELEEAKAKTRQATSQMVGLKADVEELQKSNKRLNEKLDELSHGELAGKILELANKAIQDYTGLEPKFFEGVEKDPVGWFKAKGFASIDGLRSMVESLTPRDATKVAATSAGKSSADGAASKEGQISDEDAAQLRELGLDPKFADIDNERGLAKLKEESAQKE